MSCPASNWLLQWQLHSPYISPCSSYHYGYCYKELKIAAVLYHHILCRRSKNLHLSHLLLNSVISRLLGVFLPQQLCDRPAYKYSARYAFFEARPNSTFSTESWRYRQKNQRPEQKTKRETAMNSKRSAASPLLHPWACWIVSSPSGFF